MRAKDWADEKWDEIASWSVNLSIDVPAALREVFAEGLKRNLPSFEPGTLRHYAAECAKPEPCNCEQSLDLRRRLEIAELQLERVRLAYACPPAADEKGRRAWDRRCREIDSKLKELSR